jgi:UDP-N-acetylglucosamine 4-epimerase
MGYRDITFPEGTLFLVTGVAGFIGSNLAEAILDLGFEVSSDKVLISHRPAK